MNDLYQFFGGECGILFVRTRHGVYPRGIIDGSIDIIHTECQRDLGQVFSDHGPIGLDMGKIIKEYPGNRIVPEIFKVADLANIVESVILSLKLQDITDSYKYQEKGRVSSSTFAFYPDAASNAEN